MGTASRVLVAVGLLGVVLAAGILGPQRASSQDPAARAGQQADADTGSAEHTKFMRQKLDATARIMEGLVTEDAAMVKQGAEVLVEMSSAEKWQVRNNLMYKQYSADFQQAAKRLKEAAEKDNLDRAALQWIDTTMSCIDCHKYVRAMILAGRPAN